MTCRSSQFVLSLLCLLLAVSVNQTPRPSGSLRGQRDMPKPGSAAEVSLSKSYGRLPLSFEVNRGQINREAKFLARGNRYNVFLTSNEIVLSLPGESTKAADFQDRGGNNRTEMLKGSLHAFHEPIPGNLPPSTTLPPRVAARIKLDGANRDSRAFGLQELPGRVNYFIGSDPGKWHTDISTYARVKYDNIYPGIDLVYYGNQGQLEHDFIVAPGTDPGAIKFTIENDDKVEVDASGDLLLDEMARLRLRKPMIYQDRNGVRTEIAGRYVLGTEHRVGFQVGNYDASLPLVIDPVLVYSTYLGGNNDDVGNAIAVDPSGNTFVAGSTLSANFPMASALQPKLGDPNYGDAFVLKLNASGTELIYSTYFGGNSEDYGHGIAVDSSGNAYVTGSTSSTNLPAVNAFQGQKAGGRDAFVFKLNQAGSALVYSTYLGGKYTDYGMDIAVDSNLNAYVTGYTNSTDFPLVAPIQATIVDGGKYGNYDAFVLKLNPAGSALIYSTYVGGSESDLGVGIAIDSSGNAYVRGYTESPNFPTSSPFQQNSAGKEDCFVFKISNARKSADLAIAAGGVADTATIGNTGPVQAGYVVTTVQSGSVPYGTAVFSLSQDGVVVSEAAVPAAPPTTSARIFVDFRSKVASPVDDPFIDIYTGLAVVNPNSVAANVTYTLRTRNGELLTTGRGSVAAGTHFAKFIDQLKEVAPDFALPPNFATATQFGCLDISSNQPLSILALRLTVNQRNSTLLTSTPIADLTKPLGNAPLYFPQFVDGGGYLTTLVLLNTSTATETGRFALFSDSGTPLIVNQAGGSRDSSFDYSINPGGAFIFQTDGSPAEAKQGSVQLTPSANTSSPAGAGIFSFSQGRIRVTESGVPAASPTSHARIFIDQSANHGTGLAIASPGTSGINVTLKAYQKDGSTPAGNSAGPVILGPNGHTARFVSQLISALPSDFRGVLDIASTSPFVALTLRSLTNSRGDFLLTTFPIADAARSAPAPIIFPQIADGGGYLTEFILLSAGGATNATINFYADDGKPLSVGK